MRNIKLMDVKRQHEEHAQEYEEAALEVLRSGRYIGGICVSDFEREFAKYNDSNFAVSCGSGTDAILLALRAAGVNPGDEVITTPMTFFTTAESVVAVGAKPVFVDVDEETYCIDPELVKDAMTEKTKAIIAVNLYGNVCDMDSLRAICDEWEGVVLITDCAQSTGAKYKGSIKGALGDIACFSFFPTKILGCDGDGGAVVCDDEEIFEACMALRAHGSGEYGYKTLKRNFEKDEIPFPSNIPSGTTKYYNYLVGYNSRLDAIQAAILNKKINYIDDFICRRQQNARKYDEAFSDTTLIIPKVKHDVDHVYYVYVLSHKNASSIMEKLKAKGIECGTYYPVALHLQGAFHDLGYKIGDFPITERLCKETFAIPVYPELSDDEIDFIIQSVKEAADE